MVWCWTRRRKGTKPVSGLQAGDWSPWSHRRQTGSRHGNRAGNYPRNAMKSSTGSGGSIDFGVSSRDLTSLMPSLPSSSTWLPSLVLSMKTGHSATSRSPEARSPRIRAGTNSRLQCHPVGPCPAAADPLHHRILWEKAATWNPVVPMIRKAHARFPVSARAVSIRGSAAFPTDRTGRVDQAQVVRDQRAAEEGEAPSGRPGTGRRSDVPGDAPAASGRGGPRSTISTHVRHGILPPTAPRIE